MTENYEKSDGTPCTLEWLVRNEPEWAASRIRVGAAAISERDEARAEVERKRLALENVKALAKRMRHKGDADNAGHLLRFCEQGGQPESVLDILRKEGGEL